MLEDTTATGNPKLISPLSDIIQFAYVVFSKERFNLSSFVSTQSARNIFA